MWKMERPGLNERPRGEIEKGQLGSKLSKNVFSLHEVTPRVRRQRSCPQNVERERVQLQLPLLESSVLQ